MQGDKKKLLTIDDLKGTKFVQKLKRVPRPVGRGASKFKNIIYKNEICTFDIETSAIKDIKHSVMYLWQVHFYFTGVTIIGRTWNEFRELCMILANQLRENERLCFYVHWLSHEFQYLKGIYRFSEEDIFAIDDRKIAKCLMLGKLEFRCSYILANQGLESFLIDMGCETTKGKLDYSVMRWYYSKLDAETIDYSVRDVVGLAEAIYKLMSREGDTLYTIPMTSTGYIRREIKRALHDFARNNRDIYDIDADLLVAALHAFRGGDTHANRFYAGVLIDMVMKKKDFSSSYPFRICCEKFPMSKFVRVFNGSEIEYERYKREGYAILTRVKITKLELKNPLYPDPYISVAKCENKIDEKLCMVDNGRVMSAPECVVCVTDVDMNVINDVYKYDGIEYIDMWVSKYDYLPKELVDIFLMYYGIKTSMKGDKFNTDKYDMSKRKFNAGYGCMVQSPLKKEFKLENNALKIEYGGLEDAVSTYKKQAYLSYFWGVWTTAYARHALHVVIEIAGYEGVLYWDTDSLCYIDENGNICFKAYNDNIASVSKEKGMCAADINGNMHYGGVFEDEKPPRLFKTYGSKKYVTEYEDGEVLITISGVNKEMGSKELVEMGGIKEWNLETKFTKSGGSAFYYNDNVCMDYVNEDGKKIRITDNVYSESTTYTMHMNSTYEEVLKQAKELLKIYRQNNAKCV